MRGKWNESLRNWRLKIGVIRVSCGWGGVINYEMNYVRVWFSLDNFMFVWIELKKYCLSLYVCWWIRCGWMWLWCRVTRFAFAIVIWFSSALISLDTDMYVCYVIWWNGMVWFNCCELHAFALVVWFLFDLILLTWVFCVCVWWCVCTCKTK